MLDEYKGGHNTYPVAYDVVDRFVEKYESSLTPIITKKDIKDGLINQRITELRKKGYDSIIMDYKPGDNYMVMVFDKSQVVPVVNTSDENSSPSDNSMQSARLGDATPTNRTLLADALDSVATSEEDRKKLAQYKNKAAQARRSLSKPLRSFGQRKRPLRRQRRSVARSARCRTRSPRPKTASRSSTNSFSSWNRLPLSKEFSV